MKADLTQLTPEQVQDALNGKLDTDALNAISSLWEQAETYMRSMRQMVLGWVFEGFQMANEPPADAAVFAGVLHERANDMVAIHNLMLELIAWAQRVRNVLDETTPRLDSKPSKRKSASALSAVN